MFPTATGQPIAMHNSYTPALYGRPFGDSRPVDDTSQSSKPRLLASPIFCAAPHRDSKVLLSTVQY